jgi:phenylalanyl-tRNA synthetase beta chain
LLIDVTGTQEEAVEAVLHMLVCALADRRGTIHEIKINGEPYPKLERTKMGFDIKNAQKILGVQLKKTELPQLLAKMDLGLKGTSVLVPPYRSDVIHEVDVVEDVAIAYGYDKFAPALPNFFTSGKLLGGNEIGTIMRGMGFSEIKTFTLTNPGQINRSGLDSNTSISVKNPASEEYSTLRPSLLMSVLEILENNKTKGLPQRIYEIGTAYPGGKAKQTLIFSVVDKNADFSLIRGVLQTLMSEFGLRFELGNNQQFRSYDKEKSGVVLVGGQEVGCVGEINQNTLDKYGLDFKVVVCELDLRIFKK